MHLPMTKTFTQNDLIRFLYQETSEEESREINHALVCDAGLRQKLYALEDVKRQLDEAVLEPSPGTVLSILAYSRTAQPASPNVTQG